MSESNIVPTSADMDRVVDRMYEVPEDPSPLLPPSYTYVVTAGSGTYGDVQFCLQTSALLSARTDSESINLKSATDYDTVRDSLTKQVVVVKICHGTSVVALQQELEALHTIKVYTSTNLTPPSLFALLDHGPCLDPTARYLTTSTLPIICTLESFKDQFLTLPEVFTWLIYARLSSALSWLNFTCCPSIAHGDLHPGNVLVGYPSLSQYSQLPEIKLIDFGRALIQDREPTAEYTIKYNQAVRKDQQAFLRVLALLIGVDVSRRGARGESPEDRSWDWCDFKMCVLRG
jgi:serine/threonine protein kinase